MEDESNNGRLVDVMMANGPYAVIHGTVRGSSGVTLTLEPDQTGVLRRVEWVMIPWSSISFVLYRKAKETSEQ